MSYKLEKPYTYKEYANFIVEHNRVNQRHIEETQTGLYALEPNEMLGKDGVPVINPNYEEEIAAQERVRKMNLNLTKADVLLALYEDKGLTPDDIKTMLKDNIPALIKFDYASTYYRGDDVVVALGKSLGYSEEDIDYLFENKTFPKNKDTENIIIK